MSGRPDLRLVAAAAALSAALALLVPVEAVSLLALAPLAFFLTGYAILAASMAAPPPWPQTLSLSVGLSLATLALGALPLNYLGGIAAGSWAVLLLTVVLVACAIAARRRAPGGAEARPRPSLPRPAALQIGLGAVGVAAVVAAVVLAFVPLPATHAVGFTELWLRPDAANAGERWAEVGVRSQEKRATSYRLVVRVGESGRPRPRSLRLEPGEAVAVPIPVPPGLARDRAVPVSATLFLAADPARPYRHVYGWVQPR
ncbi:MAG: hypothetical protein ACM3NV_04260 [Syntrophothermus sp.]